MAPSKAARAAAAQDDSSKAEAMPAKEKETHASSKSQTNGKQRQAASTNGAKAAVVAVADKLSTSSTTQAPKGPDSNAHLLQWSSFDRETLHNYRREYRLDTPTSFVHSYHHRVLTLSGGVGKYSPTMTHRNRATAPTRQTKEQLSFAIRKHFNSLSVVENDVVVNLIHKIREEDTESSRKRIVRRDVGHL